MNDIIRNIVFGEKKKTTIDSQFIEAFIFKDDDHLGICWQNYEQVIVYHFMIKDRSKYKEFVEILSHVLKNCPNILSARYKLENFLEDEAYQYLNDYPDDEEPEMRSKEEICEYMNEAYDRVWLVRKQNLFFNLIDGTEIINADILDGMNKAIDKVCEKYNIDVSEPVSDWDYGYWSGILAALRWVVGVEKDMLDT